ncbi:hypothetical protein NEHOM01_1159, partial [Nematocida homosporus]|uniref:uncharacterized protein n=1 Tax=Nematocida homosporus TaxID=1912981 RepID=UPI00221FC526
MSYLEINRGVNRNRIYRGRTIRYRIVIVLCSLVLVLGSVRGSCGNGMCDSKVGGDSAVVGQEITALEGWEASSKVAKDLTAIGFWVHPMKCLVYVKKHMTEEVTAVASDSTVALSPTNSTENIDMYMVLWPEPELKFTMPKINEVGRLQNVLTTLKDIVVIKAEKAVFIYNVEHVKRSTHRSKAISRVINALECKELELRIEEYDIERYSQWVSIVDCGLTQLQETIDCAASNPNRNLTVNVCCLNPSMVDLIGLKLSQRMLVAKLTLIVTVIQDRKRLLTYCAGSTAESYENDVEDSTHIDFTALHNQEIQCQKIVLINESKDLTLTGLENATQDIHSEITLELRWETLLCLIERNNPVINVHTIIVIGPKYAKNLFPLEHFHQGLYSTPHVFATKITSKVYTEECWCLKDMYNQYYTPEAYAKYGISVGESTIEYKNRQDGLLDTLKILEKYLRVNCKKSIEHVQSCGIKCPAEDRSNNKLELQEPVDINLENINSYISWPKSGYYEMVIQPNIVLCQNIHFADININGSNKYHDGKICRSILKLFINTTAHTFRITNVHDHATTYYGISRIEEKCKPSEVFQRHLKLKALILDDVCNGLFYWILNKYRFADSMELHILNQSYNNLDVARILSYPKYQKISKLVLKDFVELDEVKLYKEYKKEDKLTELPLFNYIETMKAENKTTTDLSLNKLVLQLEGLDCNKYTEILAEFNDI